MNQINEISSERYKTYKGNSESVLTHMLDKGYVLFDNIPLKNEYIEEVSKLGKY